MFNSWQEFEHLLDQRFGETKETAIVRLERCFQRPAESPKAFADRFLQDADRAGRTEDGALVYQFIQRLQADLREEVLRAKPQTIDAVVDTCNYWISARGMIDGGHPDSATPERASNKPTYKDRPEDYNQPSARRPPFERRYNSTGPGPRAPFRDNNRRNYAPPPPKPAPVMGAAAVDDLTKRFQKLEINLTQQMQQQLQEKDKVIRTLKFALEKRGRDEEAQINFMGTEGVAEIEEEGDLDYELLAELYAKRLAEETPLKRMPAKRVAFTPQPPPYPPPRRGPSQAPSRATPNQGTPGPVPQRPQATRTYKAPGASGASPRDMPATATPPLPPTRHLKVAADQANMKAKKLAADISRSIKLDGILEGAVPPQAILTCLAGHIAKVPALVALGQEMAARVENVVHDTLRNFKMPANSVLRMAPTAVPAASHADPTKIPTCKAVGEINGITYGADTGANQHTFNSMHPRAALKTSTCKVVGEINGKPTTCVLDTGASTSAVTIDCLRRMDMADIIQPQKSSYLNADGRLAASKGKVRDMIWGLGDFQTLVDPTVTAAMNYDMLVGTDVLKRAKAILDFGKDTIKVQVDPDTYQEFPISVTSAAPENRCLMHDTQQPVEDSSPAQADSQLCCESVAALTASLKQTEIEPASAADTCSTCSNQDSGFSPLLDNDSTAQSELIATSISGDAQEDTPSGAVPDSPLPDDTTDWQLFLDPYADLGPAEAKWLAECDACMSASLTGVSAVPPTPLETDTLYCMEEAEVQAPSTSDDDQATPDLEDPTHLSLAALHLDDPADPASPGASGPRDIPAPAEGRAPQPAPAPQQPIQPDPEMLGEAMELLWPILVAPGYPEQPMRNTPLGAFMRQQLHDTFFSQPVRDFPVDSVVLLTAIKTAAREFGCYDEYHHWVAHGLAAWVDDITMPVVRRHFPALVGPALRAQAAVAAQAREGQSDGPDEPGTPTATTNYPDCLPTWVEPTWLDTPDLSDEPEEINFMDIPDSDTSEDVETDTSSDMDSDIDSDELPALVSDSDEDDDALELYTSLIPDAHKVTVASPQLNKLLNYPSAQPDEYHMPPDNPLYLETRALPDEEACPFPDDEALADNSHLSLRGLVDVGNLSAEECDMVVSLLQQNKDVFCFNPSQLGTCTVGTGHSIDTGDAAPIKQAYYRMPFAKQQELNAHVQKWLELGIIRPSSSPWSSPMHLVPKKGGETRAVIDYRKLNAVTRKDAFPLPRIDDILYNLGTANYFSVVDLFSGYFQIPMAGLTGRDTHDSIAKTAFCCPSGLFEFVKMSFGMCNAPAVFMRTITEVLKPYIGKFVFVFMDDVIVFSPDLATHCRQLQLVFQALKKADLRLSSTKCRFATSHCTFLGFSVSAAGLGCDPRLIEAISLREEPYKAKNPKKATMSFLGLCGFYRRFVKDYAIIAEPLTRLTGKNQKFQWGPEQQEAFDTLKDKLMAYPLLRRPDYSRPFYVHTDASVKAVGAVLTQRDDDGREYAVAYHSAKLTPTQRNWAVTHLECFAVVSAVCDAFKDFLLGNTFTVVSDHTSLRWLMTCTALQGKLARWSLRLQEFLPFTIEYRKGTQHLAADALSRDPRHEEDHTPNDQPSCRQDQALMYESILALTDLPTNLEPAEVPPSPERPVTPSPRSVSSLGTDTGVSSEGGTPIRISIEGNIGCGKSTVLAQLLELQGQPFWDEWHMLPEPVAEWHNLLGPFYSAPPDTSSKHTAATVLQVAVLNSYALHMPDPVVAPLAITERSPWSSLAVFLPAQRLPSSMEEVVRQTAHHMHASLDNALPTALIYLDVDPEVCLKRVEQRQRPGEAGVTLDYLRTLHQQYDRAVSRFPGPKVVIHANGNRSAVFEAVKDAIRLLHSQHTRNLPTPSPRMMPHPLATPPFAVHESALLQRLCPGQLMTTLDPYLLRMYPDQLLACSDAEEYADAPDTHPQGTPVDSISDSEPSTPSDTSQAVSPLFEYIPTDASMLYDQATEVSILFQAGPGSFRYSPLFESEYLRIHGTPVDPNHRVDNHNALELYATLGPWAAAAPGAHIAVAIAPRKALAALRVTRVYNDGSESVYVDSSAYASIKLAEKQEDDHTPQVVPDCGVTFSWEKGFRNEAFTLDGWIRFVRLRPAIPCGVALDNPSNSTLTHGAVTPLPQEHQPEVVPQSVRLASCLPHTAGQDISPAVSPSQINVLDKPPRRKSAKNALKRMSTWTKSQNQEITDPTSVPTDLPCAICSSPFDDDLMMLCDHCDRGYHTYCIGLQAVPAGSWICPGCALPQPRPIPTISSPSPTSREHSPSEYVPKSTSQETSDSPGIVPAAQLPLDPFGGPALAAAPIAAADLVAAPATATGLAAAPAAAAGLDDFLDDDAGEEPEDDDAPDGPILEVWDDAVVMHYLQHSQYNADLLPDDDPGKELKRVDKRANNYLWSHVDKKLFKSPSGRHTSYREVPPPSARPSIITQMHTDLGHVGATKLCSVLMARYYWRGMHQQVAAQLKGCDNCLRHKTLFKLKPELKPLPPSRLWERVNLDSMGPYPATKAGARYICVAVDAMSKYVEAWPTPKLDSATMAQFFEMSVMANHGLPRTVVTDQGKEFQLAFSDLMTDLGVQHVRSAAYNPQSNGQAEAAVKTILHGLQKAVGTHPHTWDKHLPHVLLGLRSATHSTTGYSPFFINTGRHPVLPAERRLVPPAAAAGAPADAYAPTPGAQLAATDAWSPDNCPAAAAAGAGPPTSSGLRPRTRKRTATSTLASGMVSSASGAADTIPTATDTPASRGQSTAAPFSGEDSLDHMLDEGTRLLMRQRQESRDATHANLESNILRSQAKQKMDYAKRHHGPAPEEVMPPDSFVLMWVPPHNKLSKVASCEGPYRLVEYRAGSQALIEDSKGQRWPVAISRLAPYRP
jgi:thymidylate kinase/transposase InsO family protein